MTTLNRNFVVKNGIEVATTANVGSTLGVTGATTLANTIAVTGNATFSNTLTVTGLVTFNNGVVLGDATSDQIAIIGGVNTDIIPVATGVENLGNTSNRWLSVWANNITLTTNVATAGITTTTATVSGLASLNGGVILGDAAADQIAITGVVNTHIIPSATASKDLGNTSTRWSSIWANNITLSTNVSAVGITATDVTISGNLTVSGTTTYINTTDLNIGDNTIVLNADLGSGVAPTQDAGFVVNRGSSANVAFLWNETSDAWTISNTSVTGTIEATSSVNAASHTIGTTFIANTTGVYHTGTINAASYTIGSFYSVSSATLNHSGSINAASHTVGSSLVANTLGVYHTGVINAASHTVGSSLVANTLGVYHTGIVNAASHTVGSSLVANTLGVYHTGIVNAASITTTAVNANTTGLTVTGFANVSTSVNTALVTVGTAFIANTTGVYHTGVVNSATVSTSNLSVSTSLLANTTTVTINAPLRANSVIGTSGYILTSNGATGAPYWSAPTSGATGGGTDEVFVETGSVVTTDYTITTNKNAMSVGPITINNGVTVTIPNDANWVIL